jgi:hypothetical protein
LTSWHEPPPSRRRLTVAEAAAIMADELRERAVDLFQAERAAAEYEATLPMADFDRDPRPAETGGGDGATVLGLA